jgi:hypothetical protein
MAERVTAALTRLALTGQGDIRWLRGQLGHRLRVGDWRVIFEHDPPRAEIHVLALAHRRDAYR